MTRAAERGYDATLRRRLTNLLTVLSALLLVAVAGLWVRSYWRYDQVNWFGVDNSGCLSSGDGVLAVMVGPNYKGPGALAPTPGLRYRNYAALGRNGLPGQMEIASHRRLRRLGLAYDRNRLVVSGAGPPYYSSHRFYVPHWLALLALAALPAAWARRRWKQRRAAVEGRCRSCGYDLRATPGRCPECGATAGASSNLVAPVD